MIVVARRRRSASGARVRHFRDSGGHRRAISRTARAEKGQVIAFVLARTTDPAHHCARTRLLIKTFLVQAFYIPSGSMEDTLAIGDRVLVNKLAYKIGDIQRGDIIVFNGVDSWAPEVQVAEPFESDLGWAPFGLRGLRVCFAEREGLHQACHRTAG